MQSLRLTRRTRRLAGAAIAALLLGGCLSDDDGDGGATSPPPAQPTTLSGAAVGGAISGQVCAYSLSDAGAIGTTALACTATNATTGAYSLSFSGYAGNVLLRAFGTYLDESTNTTRSIAEADAIRSMVSCPAAGGACVAAITPLTEIALRLAGTLTPANIENAYRTVAQAFGLTATTNAQAVNLLVGTLSDLAARTNAAATAYADLLALASQAQALHCGPTAACSLNTWLANAHSVLGGANPLPSFQSALSTALQAWNTNPNNTHHVNCALNAGIITCTLPTSGGGGGGGGSGGLYRLTVTVTAAGFSGTAIVVENVQKPTTQDQFCNAPEVTQQVSSQLGALGTFTINSCSFSGNAGTITATVNITQPLPISVSYTVNYQYAPM